MRINSICNASFRAKGLYGDTRNLEKRSLIDGRPLAKDEILDDVFEFCTKLKNKINIAKPLTFTDIDKEYISGLPVSSQVPRLMNLINSKNK